MTTTITDNFPASLDGYSIQIRFRNSDISALNLKEPDLSALGISVMTTATSTVNNLTSGSSITTGLTSTPTLPVTTTKGLSQGARVAIGVVIPTFLTSLCFGLFLYFRRRKMKERSNQNLQPKFGSVEVDGTGRHEADGRIIQPFMQPYELDSAQLAEADPDPDGPGTHVETISEPS